jgi:hypothetical protein
MTEKLGVIGDTFLANCQYYGVLLQIAHEGQNPTSDEPAFRLLRFLDTKASLNPARALLEKHLGHTGNILLHMRDTSTLICKNLDRQTSADYVLPQIDNIKKNFTDYIRFLDEDFASNRQARKEGNQDEAREKHKQYIRVFNNKGWVKYMRKKLNIHPDVDVIPGMHTEAEVASLHKRQEEAAAANTAVENADGAATNDAKEIAQTTETPVKETDDENEVAEIEAAEGNAYPDVARKKGQRFAAVSMIMDDGDDMEVLLFVHGVYADLKSARDQVENDLNDALNPLPIDIIDMYEWVYPVRMNWENNTLSKRVVEMEESWSNMQLSNTQMERFDAVQHNRKLKHDISKKKGMDASVKQQLCERLALTDSEFMQILDTPEQGADAIIRVVKIEDEAERTQAVRALLDCKSIQ